MNRKLWEAFKQGITIYFVHKMSTKFLIFKIWLFFGLISPTQHIAFYCLAQFFSSSDKPALVLDLMDNLVSYINNSKDSYKPLVRIAIIHAQFETIHPFIDGNGRNIISSDNTKTVNDFYDKIAFGGKEQRVNDNMRITRMADGTVITMRKVSHSDGTPVVDINISKSTHTGGVKDQKIHFVLEDEK